MRDYSNISDDELNKLCFIEADEKYIANIIEKTKQQVKEGKYKVIVSVTNVGLGEEK